MAYISNNYHIASEAGVTAVDTIEQSYTKIANWLNSILSGEGTAEVYSVDTTYRAVKFMYNGVRTGFAFGNLKKTSSINTGLVTSIDGEFTTTSAYYVMTNIYGAYLYYAKGDYGSIIEIYELNNTDSRKNVIVYKLSCTDSGGVNKWCTMGFLGANSSADSNYTIQVENETGARINGENASTNLLSNLAVGQGTLLSRFFLPYTDFIPDGAYFVTGNIPETRTVFELNGNKYVGIIRNSNKRFVVALKLE